MKQGKGVEKMKEVFVELPCNQKAAIISTYLLHTPLQILLQIRQHDIYIVKRQLRLRQKFSEQDLAMSTGCTPWRSCVGRKHNCNKASKVSSARPGAGVCGRSTEKDLNGERGLQRILVNADSDAPFTGAGGGAAAPTAGSGRRTVELINLSGDAGGEFSGRLAPVVDFGISVAEGCEGAGCV